MWQPGLGGGDKCYRGDKIMSTDILVVLPATTGSHAHDIGFTGTWKQK